MAYVDYKTVLQIDTSVQAAHDAVNRYHHLHVVGDLKYRGIVSVFGNNLLLFIHYKSVFIILVWQYSGSTQSLISGGQI